MLERQEHHVELVAQDEGPVLVAQRLDRGEAGRCCVRVEHVNAAVLDRDGAHPVGRGCLVGQVDGCGGRHHPALGSHQPDRFSCLFDHEVTTSDDGALAGEEQCRSATLTTGGAGDLGDLAVEATAHLTAIGLTGEPTAPVTGSGAAVSQHS